MSTISTHSKLEKFEAFFSGVAFDPHRHDTYAVGRTLSGVHCFRYRGEKRVSLPGNTIVIHPDELHDGEAGTADGFRYRIVYIHPHLIQTVIGGKPLPYIENGVSKDLLLQKATAFLMDDVEPVYEPLQEDDIIFELAHALSAVSSNRYTRLAYDYGAAEKAREYIHDSIASPITLDDLAQVSGREKWSLSRDFRALYGTSPYRYLVMRRLSLAKQYMFNNHSLSDSALIAGFHDQSHMTNHFKKAFGITPKQWLYHTVCHTKGLAPLAINPLG